MNQGYRVLLGDLEFPVAPSKIEWQYNGDNQTVSLANHEEINLIRPLKLTDFSFSVLLPHWPYPFAYYPNGEFVPETYYLQRLGEIMQERAPVAFAVIRPEGYWHDNRMEMVTLEEYSVSEEAENGSDVVVDIKLKLYRAYATSRLNVNGNGEAQVVTERPAGENQTVPSEENPLSYTVQSGDSLWTICQRQYGDGSKCWEVASRNGISNPNVVSVGQVIILD